MKKIISCLLVFAILCSISILYANAFSDTAMVNLTNRLYHNESGRESFSNVDYMEDDEDEWKAKPEFETIINFYKPVDDIAEYKILGEVILNSQIEGESYTLCTLEPYGYAIIFNSTGGLAEACYDKSDIPIINTNDGAVWYYGGPSFIYKSINHSFYSINDEVINAKQIDDIRDLETMFQSYEYGRCYVVNPPIGLGQYERISAGYSYFSNLEKFGTNTQGSCTVLAAAILFGYYDIYRDNRYVQDTYRDGNGTTDSFHNLLCTYVYGSSPVGGIFIRNALTGFNRYLHDVGFHSEMKSVYSSQNAALSKIINRIGAGEPVIASMGTHLGASANHTVVVYSVYYCSEDPIANAMFTVHYGHHGYGNSEQTLSAGWFYECGYMDNIGHALSYWQSNGEATHTGFCSSCNYSEIEGHIHYIGDNVGPCTKCGEVF